MARGMACSEGARSQLPVCSVRAQLCSCVPPLAAFGLIHSLLLLVASLQQLSSRERGCSL